MGGTVLLALKDHLVQLVHLGIKEGRGQWGQEDIYVYRTTKSKQTHVRQNIHITKAKVNLIQACAWPFTV